LLIEKTQSGEAIYIYSLFLLEEHNKIRKEFPDDIVKLLKRALELDYTKARYYILNEYVVRRMTLPKDYCDTASTNDEVAANTLLAKYFMARSRDKFEEYLYKMIPYDPKSGYSLLKKYHESNNNQSMAIDMYTISAKFGNKNVMFKLGVFYQDAGMIDKAFEYYNRCMKYGSITEPAINMAVYHMDNREYDKVIELLVPIVDMVNNNTIREILADCYRAKNDSIKELEHLLRIDAMGSTVKHKLDNMDANALIRFCIDNKHHIPVEYIQKTNELLRYSNKLLNEFMYMNCLDCDRYTKIALSKCGHNICIGCFLAEKCVCKYCKRQNE